jgi:hypothetical protein
MQFEHFSELMMKAPSHVKTQVRMTFADVDTCSISNFDPKRIKDNAAVKSVLENFHWSENLML